MICQAEYQRTGRRGRDDPGTGPRQRQALHDQSENRPDQNDAEHKQHRPAGERHVGAGAQ